MQSSATEYIFIPKTYQVHKHGFIVESVEYNK